jgi:hypothetical protein
MVFVGFLLACGGEASVFFDTDETLEEFLCPVTFEGNHYYPMHLGEEVTFFVGVQTDIPAPAELRNAESTAPDILGLVMTEDGRLAAEPPDFATVTVEALELGMAELVVEVEHAPPGTLSIIVVPSPEDIERWGTERSCNQQDSGQMSR